MRETEKAFFQRSETISAIDEIRRWGPITIYVGAGVSMDRSGVSWGRLVEELLEQHVPDPDERHRFVEAHGALFAASAAHRLYEEVSPSRDPKDARERMVDVIRPLIYSAGIWRAGELAPAIADFVYQWNMREDSTKSPGTACLVTTNYDDYLTEALENAHHEAHHLIADDPDVKDQQVPSPTIAFPTIDDPLTGDNATLSSWVTGNEYPKRDEVACIYLHGYLPRNLKSSDSRYPVISESDYYASQASSEQALKSLFSRSNVLIVGASITDPPLIRALESTSQNGYSRWAVLQPKSDDGQTAGDHQKRLLSSRLAPLNVKPLYTDYYVQQAQFFRELVVANTLGSRVQSYLGRHHGKHYYARMAKWWRLLKLGSSPRRTELMQWEVHDWLVHEILPDVRAELSALQERLKLEIWVRWDPRNERSFRLFGSTVGVWLDHDAMRLETINDSVDSVIIQAFREGRPTLSSGDKAYGGRWQTVLAVPIWSEKKWRFVSAVIILASQEDPAETALNENNNRAALAETTRILQRAGLYVTEPDNWEDRPEEQ